MVEIKGKIPIRIHPFFWILVGAIGWLNSLSVVGTFVWAGVITVSVLFHEFGHALSALFFGQTAEIELVGFGGVTRRQGKTLRLWQEFIIVLNGPLAGFLLFFIAYAASAWIGKPQDHLILYDIVEITMYVNLFWTAVNLLPVLPLDGAQLVRIVLESMFGLKGIRFAALFSLVLAIVIATLSLLYQFIIAAAFFFLMAFESYRAWSTLRGMTDQDTHSPLQDLLQQGEELFKQGHYDEAVPKLMELREQVHHGMIYTLATQYLAHIDADQGKYQEAYDLLLPIKKDLHPEYQFLLLQVTYRLGKWKEAIELGERVFQENPTSEIALINALSYGALGQVRPALGWLKGAIQAGLDDIPKALRRKEFDPIRLLPEFEQFVHRYH